MARLDLQKPPGRLHQRKNSRYEVRGYDSRPHSPWGDTLQSPATGATAGTPGSFTPAGSLIPARADLLAGLPVTVTPSPGTAWTTNQRVVCADSLTAYWNGSAWVAGQAP